MREKEALDLWRTILIHNTGLRPTEAIVVELQRYSGLDASDVRENIAASSRLTRKKWEDAEGLNAFYNSVSNWVFGTLAYHARQADGENVPLPVQAAVSVDGCKPGDHLDFGSGVATASLLFAELGWRVTAADISEPLLQFAAWRFKERGVDGRVINLSEEPLPANGFDLITAFNTMAHVPDPQPTFGRLHRSLRDGGRLIFDIDVNRNDGWHLHAHHFPLLRVVRRTGFKKRSKIGVLYVFERVERNLASRVMVGSIDALRYNGAVSWLGDIYRRVRWGKEFG